MTPQGRCHLHRDLPGPQQPAETRRLDVDDPQQEGTLEAGDDVRADWSEKVNEVVFEKIRKQEPVATTGRRAR